MGWFFYAFVGVLFIVLYSLGTKVLIERRHLDPVSLVIVYKIIGALFAFVLTLLNLRQIFYHFSWELVVVYVIGTILFGAANIFLFKAFPLTEISDISLINSTQPIITMLLGAVVFSEGLTWSKAGAAIFCAVGITILYTGQARIALTRGHVYTILSTCAFAVGAFADKFIVERVSVLLYTGLGFTGVTLFIMASSGRRLSDLRIVMRGRSTAAIVMVLASIAAAGTYFFMLAYAAGGQASEVSIVMFLNTILVVLVGAALLGERDRLPQKFTAAALTLVALILIRH